MSRLDEQQRLIGQLRQHGIRDERVLAVMEDVPRDRFVPDELRQAAFDDHALPIGAGQTISQPYMVALMTQELALSGEETVLEIGTGSGYQAAILARLCRFVVTIERIAELSFAAQKTLEELGVRNVEFRIGDGTLGCPERAPFEGIIVTAGAPKVPPHLFEQLTEGGRLVIPIGTGRPQVLQCVVRIGQRALITDSCKCSFVPLIGADAWPDAASESGG